MSSGVSSFVRLVAVLCACLLAPAPLRAQAPPPAANKSLVAQGFTYQGQLRRAGALVNGLCDFRFTLWDAADLGTALGVTEDLPAVVVSGGQFTVTLNEMGEFGGAALNGQARWLAIDVRCGAEPGYTALLPRQPLNAAPYALALPGVVSGAFPVTPSGSTAGTYAVAMGRRARAVNNGALVWADSTNADFSSSADNQVALRAANGMFIANDAGGAKVVPVGTRYRDNAVVAWARVTAAGGLDTNFNVASVTRLSTGVYRFVLNSSLSSGFSLVPVVTPEVDPVVVDPATPPTGAANVRIPAVNNVAAGNTFDVYMYNGNFALVDNDFQVMVTGR